MKKRLPRTRDFTLPQGVFASLVETFATSGHRPFGGGSGVGVGVADILVKSLAFGRVQPETAAVELKLPFVDKLEDKLAET